MTAEFPLRPFVDRDKALDLANPNAQAYNASCDVAKPTAALGYVHAQVQEPNPAPWHESIDPR